MSARSLGDILADLAALHDVYVVEFGINLQQSARSRFNVTFHWKGHSNRGHYCVLKNGITPVDALEKAISALEADRLRSAQTSDLNHVELADQT